MKRFLPALLLGALAVMAGCASGPRLSDSEKVALYRAHAGEPVRDFSFFGRINGWTPLGDSALAVHTRPSEAYLLELFGPCPDLDFAQAISLSSQMSRVSAGFDSVTPVGGGTGSIRIPCRIESIRPLDLGALRDAQTELREAQVIEREASAD